MLYFEDLPVGHTETFPSKLITKEEIVGFAEQYDPQPHHLDEEAAKQSLLGGLAASGWHICCILARMAFANPPNPTAFLGSPGIEEVRWKAPLRPGDEVYAVAEVLDARPSKSQPHMGLVKRRFNLFNQEGTLLTVMDTWAMIARRTTQGDAA